MGQQLPFLTAATPEFLKILGIQLVEGRLLAEADDRGAPVVIVNQAMARGVWPGESAVGKCIRIGFDPVAGDDIEHQYREAIGIAAAVAELVGADRPAYPDMSRCAASLKTSRRSTSSSSSIRRSHWPTPCPNS